MPTQSSVMPISHNAQLFICFMLYFYIAVLLATRVMALNCADNSVVYGYCNTFYNNLNETGHQTISSYVTAATPSEERTVE